MAAYDVRWTKTAIALEILLAFGALGGGLALMAGPRGEILPLPISALAGSPFADYAVPGVILFAVLGLGPLVVAAAAWRGSRWAPLLTFGSGLALLIWITVEVAVIGFAWLPPLQPIYIVMGIAIAAVGLSWRRSTGGDSRTR